MNTIAIRRIQTSDSLDELTTLLHRAFGPLGRRGIHCSCVDQDVQTTRNRLMRGDAFVAEVEGKVVGTITMESANGSSPLAWYRNVNVASIHQFGVDPAHQGTGVGSRLLARGAAWARARGCTSVALDTPDSAVNLHAYYMSHGFRRVAVVQQVDKDYRSVVFDNPLGGALRLAYCNVWPTRRPSEMAALAQSLRNRAQHSGRAAA
jgi:predicted N-acetyltransferase YhbS